MPEPSSPELFRPGSRLGPYTLLSPLAIGGMGTVWSAALVGERGFSKLVAIKTILHELADEVQYVRALRDEAQLAAALNHPHLCDVTELGEASGYPFLVMEWVDGGSLAELLDEGADGKLLSRIDPILASQIAAGACAGLHALHEARDPAGVVLGAVHRDVSPHNILISQRGQVKIADLGVAKARGQWRSPTRSGELRGKLGYLAPEQLRGDKVDRRADVHAVGVVLYVCLAGVLPYPADSTSFDLLLAGKYRPLEELRPDLPRELGAIVAKALQTAPDARFQTALALRDALETWRAEHACEHGQERIVACLNERLGPIIKSRNDRIRAAFVHHVRNASGQLYSGRSDDIVLR
jgi:eukaryotic-like serine/threonine-protein kinase